MSLRGFKVSNGSDSTNGSTSHESGSEDSLYERVARVAEHDREKTELIQELLIRYTELSQQYRKDWETRNLEIQQLKLEKAQYQEHITTLRICLERDPFVVVLIDADGMIFQDDLIKAGEEGGRKASGLLHSAVVNYVQREAPHIPTDVKVLCRVYANVRGLADVLLRIGVIDDANIFEQFTGGFTRGKVLFDFVDVGPGKDRADEKIIETFKLYLNDFHCRHIFFGCSHDNGYARILEDHATDEMYLQRITLLEGVPFEKELSALPFTTKKFPGIFRDTKLVVPTAVKNYANGMPSHFPPPRAYNGNGLSDSPTLAHIKPMLSRPASTSTLNSVDSAWTAPSKRVMTPNSWAAKAAAPAPPVADTPTPVYKPANRDELIARNRIGQRVDPPCRDYDKAEVDRVKKMKMCNVHFLRQECPYNDNCTHRHDYKPTKDELNTLKLVARLAPCLHGSGCQDIKCIYGHRCPAPTAKNAVKGTKSCIFGESCKFPPELHDVDCNVVRTLVLPQYIDDLIGLRV